MVTHAPVIVHYFWVDRISPFEGIGDEFLQD